MAPRHTRISRRLSALVVAVGLVVALTLLAGVVTAAHRNAGYRSSVDSSYAGAASAVVEASNVTGNLLAFVVGDPGAYGRSLLESKLQWLDQRAIDEHAAADRLAPPPPDANADARIVETMRLRATAVAEVRTALEGMLALTPASPAGAAVPDPPPSPHVGLLGAQRELADAGQRLVDADATYIGLPIVFAKVSPGSSLPPSRWTSATTGRLLPASVSQAATKAAGDPRLAATVRLYVAAVQTDPLLLPLGAGYPVPPTETFTVAVSVRNAGTAPSLVVAFIRVQPTGRVGRADAARASGSVTSGGAVALSFRPMKVVPGEHCLVTITIVRPAAQRATVGLVWTRNVIVGQSAPRT